MEFFVGENVSKKYLSEIKNSAFVGHVLGKYDEVVKSLYCVGLMSLFKEDVDSLDIVLLHVGKIVAGFSGEDEMYQYMVRAMKTDDIFWDDFDELIEGEIAFQFCVDMAIIEKLIDNQKVEKNCIRISEKYDMEFSECRSLAKIIVDGDFNRLLSFSVQSDSFKIHNSIVYFKNVLRKTLSRTTEGCYLHIGKWDNRDIEWQLLKMEDGKVLVISRFGIDGEPFHRWKDLCNTCWEQCTLRSWLNNVFYNNAFCTEEKIAILFTRVTDSQNKDYDTNPGRDTDDRIFLLSLNEVDMLFDNDEQRKCVATSLAKNKGVSVDSDTECVCWWLRSPGDYGFDAAEVDYDGYIDYEGTVVISSKVAVRPAMWVDLTKLF